jgi:hypothetical protein
VNTRYSKSQENSQAGPNIIFSECKKIKGEKEQKKATKIEQKIGKTNKTKPHKDKRKSKPAMFSLLLEEFVFLSQNSFFFFKG